jgi:hypothetical protein
LAQELEAGSSVFLAPAQRQPVRLALELSIVPGQWSPALTAA